MGLAASQLRLLSLTARIHDVEYQAQMIQSAKLQLATQEDEVYRKYNEALDATTLTFQDMQGNRIAANFNNLCGAGSINNNIAGNKHYVFRDKDDNLIIPSDVYEGYQNYGGEDPYAFAMYMMGVDIGEKDALGNNVYAKAVDEYTKNVSDSEYLKTLNEEIENLVKKLFDDSTSSGATEENKSVLIKDMTDDLKLGHWDNFIANFNIDSLPESTQKDIDILKEKMEEYQHKVFKKGDGAAEIYAMITGEDKEDFDTSKFDYYLRWGKLIQQEEGLNYCTAANEYSGTFESDAQALQDMLQAGYITVDVVSMNNKTGKIDDSSTSVASDSTLEYTTTSTIDKKALAKAEAEYEHAMKQIDKKDKQFDMDLNRLETERTALTTEYDSVKKVIQDNIERTFGIFS